MRMRTEEMTKKTHNSYLEMFNHQLGTNVGIFLFLWFQN